LVEHELPLDLADLLEIATSNYSDLPALDTAASDVFDFMLERFRFWFEEESISAEVYLAVHALKPRVPLDFVRRARAVSGFAAEEASAALIAGNKRVSNILSKLEGDIDTQVNNALLQEAAEKALYEALSSLSNTVATLVENADYQGALNALSQLREPIDRFFDEVRVMAEDEAVRANRLAILANLRSQFIRIADISALA